MERCLAAMCMSRIAIKAAFDFLLIFPYSLILILTPPPTMQTLTPPPTMHRWRTWTSSQIKQYVCTLGCTIPTGTL